MGTRCGQLDPGAILALLGDASTGLTVERLSSILYRESGLLALSGVSADMREVVRSGTPAAAMAIQYFVQESVKAIGAMSAAIDGLDTLVISGGIGEHQHELRTTILKRLAWLGVELAVDSCNAIEKQLKDHLLFRVSTPHASVAVFVVSVDEQRMMVEHAARWAREQKIY